MDKNTIIGLILIFLILIGFSYFNRPSEEQRLEMLRQDSIAKVERKAEIAAARQQASVESSQNGLATPSSQADSVFFQANAENKIITLENDKIKLHISTQGGQIVYVDLKEYRTHDSLPLVLWKKQEATFGLNFYALNQEINTEKLFFTPGTTETTLYAKDQEQTLSMRLYADSTKYIEYLYKLAPDSYMTDFSILTHEMGEVIASNSSFLTLNWGINMPQLEKSKEF